MRANNLVRRIARFHKNYESRFLNEKTKNKTHYLKSPKDALFFILSTSFYQGRRDEISQQFERRAKATLNSFLEKNDIFASESSRITDKEKLKVRYKQLYELLKQERVNKEGDRLMVISLINFIQFNEEKNILKFLVDQIRAKKIMEAYVSLDGIWSIGSKIASLILRDVVYIYGLENYLDRESYYLLQPIDTWVHQLSKRVGLVDKNKIYKGEAKDITEKCFEFKTNPIQYNQGAWYIGSNSLEIVLKNINKI